MDRICEPYAYGPEPHAQNYWRSTLPEPISTPQLDGQKTCDFAIIGAGFTGLNAALELSDHGADVCVLEAETIGWGASGRNGGFACIGGDKAARQTLLRRFGADELAHYHHAQRAAVDEVADNLDRYTINADRQSKGETLLAHRPSAISTLREEMDIFTADYGVGPEWLDRGALIDQGYRIPGYDAGIVLPIGFGLNPMKYVKGLANAALGQGVRLHQNTPVTAMTHDGARWQLSTPNGHVQAKSLLIATNGYSAEDQPGWMRRRYLPVQSNIMVTRPLTDTELSDQGFTTDQICADTRQLLHYFRLLPDKRMLFGLRGATRSTAQSQNRMRAMARRDFDRMFPAWRDVETTHFWSGLLCFTRSLTPFSGPLAPLPNAWGAFAYHGGGVAMGSYAGRLMAEQALGCANRRAPAFMRATPRKFELGKSRRILLKAAYAWYGLVD